MVPYRKSEDEKIIFPGADYFRAGKLIAAAAVTAEHPSGHNVSDRRNPLEAKLSASALAEDCAEDPFPGLTAMLRQHPEWITNTAMNSAHPVFESHRNNPAAEEFRIDLLRHAGDEVLSGRLRSTLGNAYAPSRIKIPTSLMAEAQTILEMRPHLAHAMFCELGLNRRGTLQNNPYAERLNRMLEGAIRRTQRSSAENQTSFKAVMRDICEVFRNSGFRPAVRYAGQILSKML